EIAAPGEAITITYGIVILKTFDSSTSAADEAVNSGPLPSNEAVDVGPLPPSNAVKIGDWQEEWLKTEGSLGSKRLLSNGMLNLFNSESTKIIESRTQLWTAKKLVENNIEKDFTEPVYNAYLFRKLIDGELQPTHVCFKKGGNYDGFWVIPGDQVTGECYSIKEFIKEIGDDKESAGEKPVNAPAIQAAACPGDYSCLEKQDGGEHGCVILASYSCNDEREKLCFKCTQTQPPVPTQQPTVEPQCIFTDEGCCNKVNPNVCASIPANFACDEGRVPVVNGCADDCSATVQCRTPDLSTCSDSDGGLNYFTEGTASGYSYSYEQPYTVTDYCQEGGSQQPALLVEWYCSGVHYNSTVKNCADFNSNGSNYACVSAACKVEPSPTPTPSPSPSSEPSPSPSSSPEPSP
ncbi:MAG: hypothetical protein V1834_02690, partial [Candidatus Micrarchaeota archaeon]